jgi:O-antigen/teichoic acid export membrane protein
MDPGSLSSRTRTAVGSLGLKGIIVYGVGLARLAVLARLLAPEAFGVFALALIQLKAFEVLTDFGPQRYLIQKKKINDELVSGVWGFNVLRGLLVGGLTWWAAPFYAGLVDAPESVMVFQVVALVPLLGGLVNPYRFLAERRVRFGRIALYETLSAVLNATITVVLAWHLRDVTALAWGLVAASLANSLLSYLLFPLVKPVSVRWGTVRELFSVGRYFLVLAVGSFLMTQGDNLLVGKLLGPVVLGYYVLAYELASMPVKIYSGIMNRVALPMFSRLQTEPDKARALLARWFDLQLIMLLPVAALFGLLAAPVVMGLYGPAWSSAVPILQALVLVTLGRGLSHILAPYILAIGRFSFTASVKGLETTVFLIGVWYGASNFGPVGAAVGAGLGYLVAALARLAFVLSQGELDGGRLLRSLTRHTAAVAIGVGTAMPAAGWLGWADPLRLIAILLLLGAGFVGALAWLQRDDLVRLVRVLLGKEQLAS